MDSVGQLAGGIAHDFNNVLTAIIGFSDLLLANHRPSDPSFQDIMNIKQNANRAAGLVRQLLAFSRRQTLRPQVLVLRDTLSDLSILLERLLGENVKLQLVHDRDLWPIKFDLNQFEQVVINLAVNGRDAMPKGGTMTIRTRNLAADESQQFGYKPLPRADYVLIEVEDTGTGMPPEVQAKIFEPFFSTKEVGKGTGLGLSTVYGIVKQTGAHIFFTSDLRQGHRLPHLRAALRAGGGRDHGRPRSPRPARRSPTSPARRRSCSSRTRRRCAPSPPARSPRAATRSTRRPRASRRSR